MIPERQRQALWTALGVGAGVAAVGWWWSRRAGRGGYEPAGPWTRPRGSAQEVAGALRRDPKLGRRRIDVDAVSEGVVELSGAVHDRTESERAVGIAQATTGVYTVVNRLRIDEEEARREESRMRWSSGAPELTERHHYGIRVGMGTRRQSPATDPDRPSDKQRLLERTLDVAHMDDAAGSGTDEDMGDGVEDGGPAAPEAGQEERAGQGPADIPLEGSSGNGVVDVRGEAGSEEGRS